MREFDYYAACIGAAYDPTRRFRRAVVPPPNAWCRSSASAEADPLCNRESLDQAAGGSPRFQVRMKRACLGPSALSVCDVPARCTTRGFFGNEAEARVGGHLRVSGVDMPSCDANLWIFEAADSRGPWEWDETQSA